ncbi:MAG: AtpZ/AtpI family protein [Acidobacteria bacterium]|nr:AtpZ/AtpI family protein [Acidobacteriota bacterium]
MTKRNVYKIISDLSAIIFLIPTNMAAGGLLGYYVIDPWLGTYPWFTLLFVLIGGGAGLYQTYQLVSRQR